MRTLAIILFFFLASLHGGSIVTDFRRDIPAMWKCWSLRYTADAQTVQETPYCMEGETPIILVHGYLNTNTGWVDFRNALKNQKLGPVYAPVLHSSAQDIRRSAHRIAEVIEAVREENGDRPVILIGHSMGGIISAYCTQHLTPRGSVKGVITLASPLRGTKTATLAFGKAAHQMQCQSRFLESLCAQIRYQPKARYICLGSSADEVVRPCQHSFFKDPGNDPSCHLYQDVGHQSFLFDEKIIADVISMIHALNDSCGSDHP